MALVATFSEDFIAEAVEATLNTRVAGPQIEMRKVCFYDGAQPATADTAITTQNLLVRITYASDPFYYSPSYSGAVYEADHAYLPLNNAIAYTYEHLMSGTVTWFRAYTLADLPMFDGTVGTADSDLVLPFTAINANTRIHLDSFDVKMAYAI